jgi:hypothetical protein
MVLAVAVLLVAMGAVCAEEKAKTGGLTHVVLFTMKEGTPKKAMEEAIADCHKMLAKIKSVRSVKAGKPTKEKAEKVVKTDYDFALVISVDDFKGLKAYLEDPIHKEFVEKHGKNFDITKLRVYDFVDQK